MISITCTRSSSSPARAPRQPDSFPNLIDNGDFESYAPLARPELWKTDPAEIFFWETHPFEAGGKALYIDASLVRSAGAPTPGLPPAALAPFGNQKKGAGIAQLTYNLSTLEAGRSYLCEVRLSRDHNIDGIYPSVSLLRHEIRLSDFWMVGEWQKFSLFFQAPESNLRPEDRTLKILIPRGDYRLVIDDLSLREFGVKAVAPEDKARAAGKVDFSWRMPATDRLVDISLTIVPAGTDPKNGSLALQKTFNNAREPRSISMSLDSFPAGPYRWRIETRQYRTLLAASEWRTLDLVRGGANIQQGTPLRGTPEIGPKSNFFPIGIYNADTADFAELRKIGFNTVHFSPRDSKDLTEKLEAARANGLKVLIPPELILKDRTFRKSELVRDTVLAFYLADEPEGRSFSPKDIWLVREKLRRLGHAQPGAVALLRSWRAPDYASSLDIFMSDPYPVPFEPFSWMAECLDEIRATMAGDPAKTVWSVIQAFGWKTAHPAQAEFSEGRDPTTDEIRAMTHLALAHGARGIFFYSYRGGGHFIKDHPGIWEGVRSAIQEIDKNR